MKCPHCKKDLIKGKLRRYETLCEHVECRYNYTDPPERLTYICPNRCAGQDAFYDPDGGLYGGKGCDCTPAIDSFDEKIEKEIEEENSIGELK